MKALYTGLLIVLFGSFSRPAKQSAAVPPKLVVLGTLQDGGSPHPGCTRACCARLFGHPDARRKVVSLGIIDPASKKTWLVEATPDLPAQMKLLKRLSGFKTTETPDGLFLTHAHIGHYAGLMYLGKEALNSSAVPVYAMPRMRGFLEGNGPWSQLLKLNNIVLQTLAADEPVALAPGLTIRPFRVPHRDEFSETVGYTISGPSKSVLFIPDINKWSAWSKEIVAELEKVDIAYLDGTFFDGDELGLRDISAVPHPFITESMALMKTMSAASRAKVRFIHFNHTNPVLAPGSKQAKTVLRNGFRLAVFGETVGL